LGCCGFAGTVKIKFFFGIGLKVTAVLRQSRISCAASMSESGFTGLEDEQDFLVLLHSHHQAFKNLLNYTNPENPKILKILIQTMKKHK
jgi:hypothetical protein